MQKGAYQWYEHKFSDKKDLNDELNAVKFLQRFNLTFPVLLLLFFLISARIIDMRLFTCKR